MQCNGCGAELDHREAFCSKCGEVTDRGKGASGLAGRYATETFNGLGQLIASAIDYLTNPANRTKVSIAAGAAVFLLISLTSNPISRSAGELFSSTPDAPTFNDDGTPNFAEYADIFIGEEAEYLVTGPANIRDFPTGQGTIVIGALAEGETVIAREVQAFDPESQWFKLTAGGYVWGENLSRMSSESPQTPELASTSIQFAPNIRGTWSSLDTCRGGTSDAEVTITQDTMSFSESIGKLMAVDADGSGQAIYEIEFSSYYENWTDRMTISPTANGFSIIVSRPENPDQPDFAYHVPDRSCEKVFFLD